MQVKLSLGFAVLLGLICGCASNLETVSDTSLIELIRENKNLVVLFSEYVGLKPTQPLKISFLQVNATARTARGLRRPSASCRSNSRRT